MSTATPNYLDVAIAELSAADEAELELTQQAMDRHLELIRAKAAHEAAVAALMAHRAEIQEAA